MADENKKVTAKENTSETAKSGKKEKKDKKPSKFSPKSIGKSIARFFKDLRGETKKIVWPTRQMVIKSTGVVLAAILVIGAGIWIIDFALAGGIGLVENAANKTETTTEVSETEAEKETVEETVEDTAEETTEESTESTTAA